MPNVTLDEATDFIEWYLRPSVRFKTSTEVQQFLSNATVEELDGFIDACENDDAYEWATVALKIKEHV